MTEKTDVINLKLITQKTLVIYMLNALIGGIILGLIVQSIVKDLSFFLPYLGLCLFVGLVSWSLFYLNNIRRYKKGQRLDSSLFFAIAYSFVLMIPSTLICYEMMNPLRKRNRQPTLKIKPTDAVCPKCRNDLFVEGVETCPMCDATLMWTDGIPYIPVKIME